jgi:hypothetical protein
MLVDVLSLTLLQLAFGIAVCTFFTPSSRLSGGFFALHGGLALAAAAAAGVASGRAGLLFRDAGERRLALPLYSAALASLLLQTPLARAGRVGASRVALSVAALASGTLLATRAALPPISGRGLGAGWLASGLLLGGLFFGAVVWAMNVGHWYLVSKTLPFQLLVRASEVLLALALARVVYAAFALGLASRSVGPPGEAVASLLDPMRDGFFFFSRVLWGLLAPAVLAPFVLKTARMKSNQAATGLLYVALVFVMIGELLATYLTLRTGLPV